MDSKNLEKLGHELAYYCEKYSIPLDCFFDILNDQKVLPMIRGKATEYNAYNILKEKLPSREWLVEKLNLNPQPGTTKDEDIAITHRRTGIRIKLESKNAVRGSMKDGSRSRLVKVPHFKVKCHRSRSNIRLAGSSNDRYSVECFDIVISNPSNAIIQGGTIGPDFELLYDMDTLKVLYNHYGVSTEKDLLRKARDDWRFVLTQDIAENGFLPRTPYVKLKDDHHWRPLSELDDKLMELVRKKSGR